MDLVLRARRVLTPAGETAAAVVVRDGVIAAVEPYDAVTSPLCGTRIGRRWRRRRNIGVSMS